MSFVWIQFKCPIERTLSGATTPSQSGPGSDDNEGVLHVAQSISRASPSDYFMSSGTLVGGRTDPLAEMQSVYSTAPATWDYIWGEYLWVRVQHKII